MAGRGGYQRPDNPAAVSGPGALSRRTDGGPSDTQPQRDLPNARYGEAKEMREFQRGAPMAGGGAGAGAAPALVPLGEPSQRPDEPVTAGAPVGPGVGPEAAGIRSVADQDYESLKPMLPSLEYQANMPGSSPGLRALVRAIKARS